MRLKNFIHYALLIVLIGACGHKHLPIDEKIKGVYALEYPSGEISLLRVNLDSTYDQVTYRNQGELRENNPRDVRKNTWSVEGEEIVFREFLSLNKEGSLEMREQPIIWGHYGAWPVQATSEHNERLLFYPEGGEIYERDDSLNWLFAKDSNNLSN